MPSFNKYLLGTTRGQVVPMATRDQQALSTQNQFSPFLTPAGQEPEQSTFLHCDPCFSTVTPQTPSPSQYVIHEDALWSQGSQHPGKS